MQILSSFIPKFNIQPTKQRSYNQSVGYNKYPNLAPLKCDTVSFRGEIKDIEDYQYGVNLKTARDIHRDALASENYLKRQLNGLLGDLVRPASGSGSLSRPIHAIRYRTKSPVSIVEKSTSDKLNNWNEIKEKMTDIVGARIVMAESTVDVVDNVIERLTEAVKNNQLKILEIENYRPEPDVDLYDNPIRKYDYASSTALKALRQACNEKGTHIAKNDKDKPSGYMAIHMLVQLPNGYTGEIQLMGKDVEDLKEVEDLCYKIKSNKHVNKKYARIEKSLSTLKNKDDYILQNAITEYTRRAYMYQREKEPIKTKRKSQEPQFLPIPDDLNFIPEKFDFNNIYREKQRCDMKKVN